MPQTEPITSTDLTPDLWNILISGFKKENKVPSFKFKDFWFFDTNCLSELIKIYRKEGNTVVQKFLCGAGTIIPQTCIGELWVSKRDLAKDILSTFEGCLVYILPDIHNICKAEIATYFYPERVSQNLLGLTHYNDEFHKALLSDPRISAAIAKGDENIAARFEERIKADIGAAVSEVDLWVKNWQVFNEWSKDWFQKEIPSHDCTPHNFPSIFVHNYAYYHRYVREANKSIDSNDLTDFMNTNLAPHCARYYCEKSFANLLRQKVKKHKTITMSEVAKKLLKKGAITNQQLENIEKLSGSNVSTPLLKNTEIYNYGEMIEQIKACK